MTRTYLRIGILLSVSLLLMVVAVKRSSAATPEQICKADINGDKSVNLSDYSIFIQNFLVSNPSNPKADINGDAAVNISDYSILISSLFQTCTTSPTATPVGTNPPPVSGAGHYYVSTNGNDGNNGSASAPFKTIQKAVNTVKSDSSTAGTVHILPGTYREYILVDGLKGTSSAPINIVAENGKNTVFIRGSESSSAVSWTKGTDGLSFPSNASSHIYTANISAWNGTPELMYNTTSGATRLPKAREPDWDVTTEWKHHENWWTADGPSGSSTNTLVDANNDPSGQYPQASELAGNLKNLGNLTGARLFFKDTDTGHDTYNVLVTGSNDGTLTLEKSYTYNGKQAVGSGTKYFVEGLPQLLDEAGEWYYNASTKKLYIWPPGDTNPSSLKLEFGVRNNVFQIKNSSYVTFKDLNIEYSNYAYALSTGPDGAIRFYGYDADKTDHITFDGLQIRHNGIGMRLYQSNSTTTATGSLSYVTIKNTVIDDTDGYALMVWHYPVPAPTAFIHHLWIENSEFGHMGFRGSGFGIFMQYAEKIVLLNNYLHHSGHNAIEMQTGKGTNDSMILALNNLSEDNCYNGSDCGAFKFYDPSNATGSRNILVAYNIFRNTKGWSYANQVRNRGNSYLGIGYGGGGYYSDGSKSSQSGKCAVIVFRNLMYGNSGAGAQLTNSRDQCLFNNVIAQNGNGINMNNYAPTTDGSQNNKVMGNILYQQEPSNPTSFISGGYQVRLDGPDQGRAAINSNIFQIGGATAVSAITTDVSGSNTKRYKTVDDIRNNTPWEDSGKSVTGGSFSVSDADSRDISAIERTFGVNSVSLPADVQSAIQTLSAEFGKSLPTNNVVGRQ